MKLEIIMEIIKRGQWYIARAPDLDFVSQGKTPEEAKRNLLEVIKIQFDEMREMGTLNDYLLECGFETKGNDVFSGIEIIGFEKSMILV